VGKFLQNLEFTLPMESEVMGMILNDGQDPMDAAKEWLTANPDAAMPWLDGVTTFDGNDAASALTEALSG
jgi:glycine betaine/proline transport system substrate-binding protein